MKKNKFAWLTLTLAATAALVVAGCDTFDGQTQHRASNLYAYLYSDQNGHIDTPTVPELSLPLRVGVAFVPANLARQRADSGFCAEDTVIPESEKFALMKTISAQFKQYPFVKSIELIPSAYLTPHGGFANLDQIRTMYNVDVMVLLFYDQAQFSGQGFWSVTYWTIVGAYVVQGERNESRTMLDAAVYDIASRKMLFRAPGIGDVKSSATFVNQTEGLRENSQAGFNMAATNLTANLQVALVDFKERVTNSPADYKITYKPGYQQGAINGTETLWLAGIGACFVWTLRKSAKRQA